MRKHGRASSQPRTQQAPCHAAAWRIVPPVQALVSNDSSSTRTSQVHALSSVHRYGSLETNETKVGCVRNTANTLRLHTAHFLIEFESGHPGRPRDVSLVTHRKENEK